MAAIQCIRRHRYAPNRPRSEAQFGSPCNRAYRRNTHTRFPWPTPGLPNRIRQLQFARWPMPDVREFRHQPQESRRRGLPALGFAVRVPEQIELITTEPVATNRATLLVCRERAGD